ncbi:MAG: nucleotidyltransferase [Bacteroidetes bacterium]|nr:nucleotidyltransferase [Bacteroidota bacterium]
MEPTLVILAAGIGSRYGGLKQVEGVGPSGETIMDYSIFDAMRAGFGKVVFVIRKDIENDFRYAFTNKMEGKVPFEFVYQELDSLPGSLKAPEDRIKTWGTGHAVMVAREAVKEPFAVINADDFYGDDAYLRMSGFLTGLPEISPSASYAMVGYDLENTLSDFGTVSRGICKTDENHFLMSVTERTKIMKSHGNIAFKDDSDTLVFLPKNAIVSMNFWGFTPLFFAQLDNLFLNFMKTNGDNIKAEFYLSTAVDDLIRSSMADVSVLHTRSHWFGVTYKEDKPDVVEKIRALVRAGIYPAKLWI